MAELRTERITKSFRGRSVLKGIDIQISNQEVVGLLGPNGAGKTTTFHIMLGMTVPDSGRVLLDGSDIAALPMYLRARRGISYLPQEPSVFRKLNVEDNLLIIAETMALSQMERREKVNRLLEEFGISHLRHSKAYNLSGGERRRLEIARSLILDPSFILLDEPFAGIDPIAVMEIQQLIVHLKNRGIGVIITDHNVRETLRITDRAYIINDGLIFRSGAPDVLAADDAVRQVYLGDHFSLH